MSIEAMKQWAEAISKAYDMTAWGHTQRAAEILKQTRNRICAAIEAAEALIRVSGADMQPAVSAARARAASQRAQLQVLHQQCVPVSCIDMLCQRACEDVPWAEPQQRCARRCKGGTHNMLRAALTCSP